MSRPGWKRAADVAFVVAVLGAMFCATVAVFGAVAGRWDIALRNAGNAASCLLSAGVFRWAAS